MTDYTYKAVIEPQEAGGYTGYIPSLPGCITEGETYEETVANLREALELYIETAQEKKIEIREDTSRIIEMHIGF
ncbi:MAG: antitoxin HicB [Spirochaetes bacterium GWF1_51_8]|nr:MAG: antitoxin HicB [Spirochaetes bacterium GWF1_51_8]